MNYKNRDLEELNKKIKDLEDQKNNSNTKKRESGAGFGFKIST